VLYPITQQAIKNEWGEVWNIEKVHDFYKIQFNVTEKVNEETGQVIKLPKSTTENTTTQQEEYHLQIREFLQEWFNITSPLPNEHLKFIPQSASSYNWNFFVSYGYENDYTKPMSAIDKKTNIVLNWVVGDGIPFIIEKVNSGGLGQISFRCPVKHGMSVGEFVKLSLSYNGSDIFQITSLGAQTYDSDEYVFNIVDVGESCGNLVLDHTVDVLVDLSIFFDIYIYNIIQYVTVDIFTLCYFEISKVKLLIEVTSLHCCDIFACIACFDSVTYEEFNLRLYSKIWIAWTI
jgi:hypothetical protein